MVIENYDEMNPDQLSERWLPNNECDVISWYVSKINSDVEMILVKLSDGKYQIRRIGFTPTDGYNEIIYEKLVLESEAFYEFHKILENDNGL